MFEKQAWRIFFWKKIPSLYYWVIIRRNIFQKGLYRWKEHFNRICDWIEIWADKQKWNVSKNTSILQDFCVHLATLWGCVICFSNHVTHSGAGRSSNPASCCFFERLWGVAERQSVRQPKQGRRQIVDIPQPITPYAILLHGRGRGIVTLWLRAHRIASLLEKTRRMKRCEMSNISGWCLFDLGRRWNVGLCDS